MSIQSRAKDNGFTLMEMMFVVCIVAILAAIALPAYNRTIERSKIIDGTTKLGDFRAQMEKWFLDNRTYQTRPAAGTACGVSRPDSRARRHVRHHVRCAHRHDVPDNGDGSTRRRHVGKLRL
jgi:prepilin-type N-terminal cleavage/methylation domain-containing protein